MGASPVKFEELLVKIGEAIEKKDQHENKIRKARIKDMIGFPGRAIEQNNGGQE